MKLPEYVTTEEINLNVGYGGLKTLPVMSFVRPIEPVYVPKHVKEKFPIKKDDDTLLYVYTHYGILRLEKTKIRKIE